MDQYAPLADVYALAARFADRHREEPLPHVARHAFALDDGSPRLLRELGVEGDVFSHPSRATKNEWLGVAGLEVEARCGWFASVRSRTTARRTCG